MKISEDTSSLFGGEELWPPGFRFHPTDEELVLYYLKRKICRRRLKIDAIAEVDVYKADPEDLPQLSKLKTGDRQWFFFSARDRKYPNGGRSNRATRHGYWKATGKDRAITCNSRSVGIKKTLVFYRGRAPSGERTDWVMHEYTVDEEELKTCPVQDYYALYKVYKKSGPGPKNGEQYGAPFREEDWADDEKAIDIVDKEQVTPLQQFSQHATSFDKTVMNCQTQSHMNGLDDLLNQIMNEPLFEPISEPFGTVQAARRDQDTASFLVNRSLGEPNVQERDIVLPPCGQFIGIQPHFNLIQSACSQLPETSRATYSTNMNRQGFHDSAENFIEHFLEIDDLIGPEPTKENNENPIIGNFGIEDFDGLCELDLFQDASDAEPASLTYSNYVGDHICDTIPISYTSNLGNGVINQVPYSCFNNFQTEIVQPNSQPYHNSLGNDLVNKFNYQLPHESAVANQPWMPNQNFSMATSAASIEGSVIPPSSGAVYAGGGNQNQNQTQNQIQIQNQIGDNNKSEDSWFSSALWSFVETIPTTPASAAESTALVTKAFGRLSSFSKRGGDSVKLNQLYAKLNAGDPNATCQRSQNRYNRSFLLFSFLGVFCAFLWVFTGTSMRVLGRCLS